MPPTATIHGSCAQGASRKAFRAGYCRILTAEELKMRELLPHLEDVDLIADAVPYRPVPGRAGTGELQSKQVCNLLVARNPASGEREHRFFPVGPRYATRIALSLMRFPPLVALLRESVGSNRYCPEPRVFALFRYGVGDFQERHRDRIVDDPKFLSLFNIVVVVQMSDPNRYEGGELVAYVQDGSRCIFKHPKFSIVILHPDTEHEVLPIVAGERRSAIMFFA
ncbi:2OG-Fe(II) oxygenase [Rhizobium leguminosarum]|uniref:2OG-Fe(II) oxygenase n=1 Tax=Rhizobium leguminosarum TaxID=384 RepID=UPI003F9C4626